MTEVPVDAYKKDGPTPVKGVLLYVAGFVAVQLVAVVLTLWVTTTPWFVTHDGYPAMRQAGYGARLKNANCEILIYGDSSSETGLDPAVIEKITGLKTCNISESGMISQVVGSRFPLDNYLKNNKRPRFLVRMLTPSVFRPYIPPFDHYQPEGMIYAMQYDHGPEMIRGLLLRPEWVARFTIWAGHGIVDSYLGKALGGKDPKPGMNSRAERDGRGGIFPFPLPPETSCVRTALYIRPSDIGRFADSVAEMRKLYGVEGTTVLINEAPVPDCDTLQSVYRQQSEGLRDNAFITAPISDFNEGDVHFSPAGALHVSTAMGQQILALMRAGDAGKALPGTAEVPAQ
jgi:hypothetical protein